MRRALAIALIPAVAMLTLAGFDILREPGPLQPVETALDIAEKLLLVAAIGAVAWATFALRELREEQLALRDRIELVSSRGEAWRTARSSEIAAFSDAIGAEFRSWELSAAQQDVAVLLLKGVSMKDIARARHTSEATIRQQAQSLYRKAGLSGRAEFAAYFLDGLVCRAEEHRGPEPSGNA